MAAVVGALAGCARGADGDVEGAGAGAPDAAVDPGARDAAGDAPVAVSRADGGDAGGADGGNADGGGARDAAAGDASDGGLPASVANGLVLHMTLDDGVAADARGQHPATDFTATNLSGAPDRFGRPTGASRFQGSPPSLVQLTPNQLPVGNAARTLALWARPRVAAPAPTPQRPHSNVLVHWGIDDCTSKMFGLGHPGDAAFGWTGCVDATTQLPVPPGAWTFLAATYDGAGTLTVWVGEQRTSRAGLTLATPAAPFALGGERKTYNEGFVYYFDGDLDDVRVWSRALSDPELTALARER